MPRPPNPEVRVRLLEAGIELIHVRGFHGCGVKDITEEAGVPKGSFYNYFESKDAFVVDVLALYWQAIERRHGGLLLDSTVAPVDRVKLFFNALADGHESREFALGCLIGNLSLELAGTSSASRDQLLALLTRWEQLVADCVTLGQADGSVPRTHDARELASVLIEAWEGAVLRAKVTRARAPYQRFEESVMPRLLAGL